MSTEDNCPPSTNLMRLGYAAICLSIPARANRTTILRMATPDKLRGLIQANLEGLRSILEFNLRSQIFLFRISSQIIPFGGHPINTVSWQAEFASALTSIGSFIRRHNMRVSFHPGQFVLLSSPDEKVTDAAIRDLQWQANFLDALGLDETHKLVIHIGGIYGDKNAALSRWKDRYGALPENIRRRLIIENDERLFSTSDVLALSKSTGIPVVFDLLHHRLNPGVAEKPLREALVDCFGTWSKKDGNPKIHFSSQAPQARPGAHADYINVEEFIEFMREMPAAPIDCMLEAKAKDLALFRLRDALASSGIGIAS